MLYIETCCVNCCIAHYRNSTSTQRSCGVTRGSRRVTSAPMSTSSSTVPSSKSLTIIATHLPASYHCYLSFGSLCFLKKCLIYKPRVSIQVYFVPK